MATSRPEKPCSTSIAISAATSRLGVLVLDLDRAHRLAVAELRPQRFVLALAVVTDDRVRGLEDRVRRAVVLLERDRLRTGKVLLELQDVANICAPKAVHRLIG